ncbi:uncharacterized protein G2W53_008480 [Senna tora]|uniref:Uncharacterized protein n=1 Tax=Senna tora TaxID=362788 RepID=A0A834XA83_9FABA|nr:uncharacterized protein G2W53_008480 [Senna tora]
MSTSSGSTKWFPNGSIKTELFRYPTATALLLDYELVQSVKPLSTGVFVMNLFMQMASPIIAATCTINDFQWPLTKDTPIIRIGKHTFVFCIPGVVFAFQFTGVTEEVNFMQEIIGVFMNYGQYTRSMVLVIISQEYEEDPLFWSVAQPLAESMAHDMLLRLGHQPGRSRFSLHCHNSCSTRATHLSAATKIITKSITSGTLLPAHISIKGGGTNDDDESQNPYSASPSIEVFTCLVDALEISWLMSGGMHIPSIRTHHMQRLRSTHDPPAYNKIWKLNEIGFEAFLKGLDSTSDQHEADEVVVPVPPPTYKGKGKEKVNTLGFVDVNENRKSKRRRR